MILFAPVATTVGTHLWNIADMDLKEVLVSRATY